MKPVHGLFAVVAAFWLAACSPEKPAAQAPSIKGCPVPDTVDTPEALVCRLYREFPMAATKDKPSESFVAYFEEDLRPALRTLENMLHVVYDETRYYPDDEALRDFQVLPFDPRTGRVRVRYTVRDDEVRPYSEFDFVLKRRGGAWRIHDMRYDGYGAWNDTTKWYPLRRVLLPLKPDPEALTGGYFKALARYDALHHLFHLTSNRMPEANRKAILGEAEPLLKILETEIDSAIGPLEVEGFERFKANTITDCEYDEEICRELDGVRLSSKNGPEILLTTRRQLRLFRLPDSEALVDEMDWGALADLNAAFDSPMPLTHPKPDGLDFFALRAGVFTNGGFDHHPPNAIVFVAGRGPHAFLGIHYLGEDTPEIPECLAAFEKAEKADEAPDAGSDAGTSDPTSIYNACYAAKMPDQPFYAAVRDTLSEIARRLAEAGPSRGQPE